MASVTFADSDLGWDEITKASKFASINIVDPIHADSLCYAEEIDELVANAFNRFYVKPEGQDVAIVPADSEEDAAMIAYCDIYNFGKDIPLSFEVKGPILSRVKLSN